MGDNEYGGGPEAKEPQDQQEPGQTRTVRDRILIKMSPQEAERRRRRRRSGGRKVLVHSGVEEDGEVRGDEA